MSQMTCDFGHQLLRFRDIVQRVFVNKSILVGLFIRTILGYKRINFYDYIMFAMLIFEDNIGVLEVLGHRIIRNMTYPFIGFYVVVDETNDGVESHLVEH